MSINQQLLMCQSLDQWFSSPQGVWVSHAFIEVLAPFLSLFRGDLLLQTGPCGTNPWLSRFYCQHQYIATPCFTRQPNHLITSLNHLPLPQDSVDCLLVPFTLETCKQRDTFIDELDRVLKPGGYLIILGINPLSLWGAAAKTGGLSGISANSLHLHYSFSINRACLARGYQQIDMVDFGHIPPVRSKKWIDNLSFMNEIGKMLWPFPAGFYCYIAQKIEVSYLQPIKLDNPVLGKTDWHPAVT